MKKTPPPAPAAQINSAILFLFNPSALKDPDIKFHDNYSKKKKEETNSQATLEEEWASIIYLYLTSRIGASYATIGQDAI